MNTGDRVKLSPSFLSLVGDLLGPGGVTLPNGVGIEELRKLRAPVRHFDQTIGDAYVIWFGASMANGWVHEGNLARDYGTTLSELVGQQA